MQIYRKYLFLFFELLYKLSFMKLPNFLLLISGSETNVCNRFNKVKNAV